MPTKVIVSPAPVLFDEARLAVAGFLARYSGSTRTSYATDLRQFFSWCAQMDLEVFAVRRGHVELWARAMEDRGLSRATIGRRPSTVAGFYRIAVLDGLLEHSPAENVRRPKIDTESATLGLDRMELSAFVAQGAAGSPVDHALACLFGPPRPPGVRGLLHRRGGPLARAGTPDRHGPGQGFQAGHHPPSSSGRPGHRSGGRGAQGGAASSDQSRQPPQPPRRHPDRAAPGEASGGDQTHLSALTASQLHNRRPRCRGAAPRRTDRGPSRRSQDHHPVRPGPEQSGPPCQLHRHCFRGWRRLTGAIPGVAPESKYCRRPRCHADGPV